MKLRIRPLTFKPAKNSAISAQKINNNSWGFSFESIETKVQRNLPPQVLFKISVKHLVVFGQGINYRHGSSGIEIGCDDYNDK
jgi:hypothetical protein